MTMFFGGHPQSAYAIRREGTLTYTEGGRMKAFACAQYKNAFLSQ